MEPRIGDGTNRFLSLAQTVGDLMQARRHLEGPEINY